MEACAAPVSPTPSPPHPPKPTCSPKINVHQRHGVGGRGLLLQASHCVSVRVWGGRGEGVWVSVFLGGGVRLGLCVRMRGLCTPHAAG